MQTCENAVNSEC